MFSCSLEMSIEPTSGSSGPLTEEQKVTNPISTLSLCRNSIFNDALNPLKVHLEKESVEQNVLDRCLMSGLQIVQRKDQEMHQVAPTLQLLLQHGAQWKDGALLEDQMTPYHLICQSTGDYHELLDLMLTSSGRALINTTDNDDTTALFYAVRNANINCVRTLIAYGADVNIDGPQRHGRGIMINIEGPCRHGRANMWSPIFEAIFGLHSYSEHPSSIMKDIFDLLVDNGADINKYNDCDMSYVPIYYAIYVRNVECVIKLIKKGAKLSDPEYNRNVVWSEAASLGSVKLIKCMLNHGIDKNSIDQDGCSLLSHVVESGDVEAVRYLLDLGVTVTSYTPEVKLVPCQKCGASILSLEDNRNDKRCDPCREAVRMDKLDIVQILVEHGSQSCQSFNALIHAVRYCSVRVGEYLLNKYTYPLNAKYSFTRPVCSSYQTLLTEPCHVNSTKITKLLLDHGADPNMKICKEANSSILLEAIKYRHEEIIALYIRNGVDINYRSCDREYGMVLPFEASVLHDRLYVTEMLLVSGCSCGMFSLDNNRQIKNDIKSDLKDLMNKWEVDENSVKSLMQQCRRMILNHLSPQADKKIMKMSLPLPLVNYLSIPELDDILTASRNSTRNRYQYYI